MKKIILSILMALCNIFYAESQLVLNAQSINPCGEDGRNGYIISNSSIYDVGINSIFFGSYNPSTNPDGIGGAPVVDYDYWWAGQQDGTGQLLSPYPTFSNFPGEACDNGVKCYGFLHPSIPADNADIDYLINQLNTVAGCNVFLPVPNSTEIIPADKGIIIFLGAGFRSSSGLCGFDDVNTNLNFSNYCSGGIPAKTFYAVFGKGDIGTNCGTNNSDGYFPNGKRRVTALYQFFGGRLTNLTNYTLSSQDYTPGADPAPGNAGIVVLNNAGGTSWINNVGCVPGPLIIVPVRLEYFTASLQDKQCLIKWKNNLEESIRLFTVEKSINGQDFYPLKNMVPLNRPNIEYTVPDTKPMPGDNFYRLKITGIDGAIEYSPIAKVKFYTPHGLVIYPNPAEKGTSLFFQSNASKKITISVVDVTGKIIYNSIRFVLPGNNKINIGLQNLSSGLYFIKVPDEGNEFFAPILKK